MTVSTDASVSKGGPSVPAAAVNSQWLPSLVGAEKLRVTLAASGIPLEPIALGDLDGDGYDDLAFTRVQQGWIFISAIRI